MKRLTAIVVIFMLVMSNIVPVYGKQTDDKRILFITQEEVSNIQINEDDIERKIEIIETKYDLEDNMPKEALDEFEEVANVSVEVTNIDDTYKQVVYNISSEKPVVEKKFKSGNSEEMYAITSYTYIGKASTSAGNVTESSVQSDITIKNKVYYNYYNNNSVKMIKITSGKTTITRFLESKMRNLVLNALEQGFGSGGSTNESKSKTIASPVLNTTYTLTSKFSNYYASNAAKILYGCEITYSHGNSSYTARAQISLGN